MARVLQIVALTLPVLLVACATAPRPGTRPALHTDSDGSTSLTVPSSPMANSRALIVQGATAMLGQPYHWGGTAPGGFDCSGLVVYATAGSGLRVPRTAEEQMHSGAAVSRGDVQAGDLVFMHLKRKELHVGIALDNDKFIHAPATGGHVRIDSLNAPVYARGYLTARRIVSDEMPHTAAKLQ